MLSQLQVVVVTVIAIKANTTFLNLRTNRKHDTVLEFFEVYKKIPLK